MHCVGDTPYHLVSMLNYHLGASIQVLVLKVPDVTLLAIHFYYPKCYSDSINAIKAQLTLLNYINSFPSSTDWPLNFYSTSLIMYLWMNPSNSVHYIMKL